MVILIIQLALNTGNAGGIPHLPVIYKGSGDLISDIQIYKARV